VGNAVPPLGGAGPAEEGGPFYIGEKKFLIEALHNVFDTAGFILDGRETG
jgi:hypothetical protein